MAEAFGLAASVITVIDLSAKVASRCSEYYANVKNARDMTTDVWKPHVSEYAFIERAQIADAFFGLEAELVAGEKALARRIQAVSDLAALCRLREQSRRGKPFD
ncbi:hypothetical protein GJ744_006279 [Endocarpon pusillum]|uniref:Uncharacterized protein n=1 Tax=Endocarpon pusillum TaxID=364733 RepID=A0A8H7A507_9EURO|nr:hypothetical protein GJ744_006279 [Endocarpon pusillum]